MAGEFIKHILIVDDDDGFRLIALQMLQKLGYICQEAPNAFIGEEKILKGDFDLVLSDVCMENKNGLTFLKETRAVRPNLDFIIMTGYAGDYRYSDIIGAGATDFIAKPFELDELKAKLHRIERERALLWEAQEAKDRFLREAMVNASVADLAGKLLARMSIEEISQMVMDHARGLTKSESGYVGYIDPSTGDLVVAAVGGGIRDFMPDTDGLPVCKEFTGLWGWVLKNREPLLTNSPVEDSRLEGVSPRNPAIHRFLSVPGVIENELVGQIALANAPHDYSERDLDLLCSLARMYAMAVDRIRSERQIRRMWDYLQNVFDTSAAAILIVDKHGYVVQLNKATENLFGYTLEDYQKRKVFDLYADKTQLEGLLRLLRSQGFVERFEADIATKSGQVLTFEMSISLLRDENRQVLGSVCVAADVSDLKKTLIELERTNAKLEQEVDHRKKAEQELVLARDQLKILVEERTAKLSQASDLLKGSISRLKEITEA